jgi:hypothetical protein
MIRGLDKLLTPLHVNHLTDDHVSKLVAEPVSTGRQRAFLEDRRDKLVKAQEIFHDIIGSL